MRNSQPKHHMDGLLVLLLFGVFALCVLSVLLTGARVYRTLNDRDQTSYDRRTAVQFLATKVRQAPGAISVAHFGAGEALVLEEEIEGETYLTRLYCHDGCLRELFTNAADAFEPQDGEVILPALAMDLELEDGLLSVTLTAEDGTPLELNLALRTGEGAAS